LFEKGSESGKKSEWAVLAVKERDRPPRPEGSTTRGASKAEAPGKKDKKVDFLKGKKEAPAKVGPFDLITQE